MIKFKQKRKKMKMFLSMAFIICAVCAGWSAAGGKDNPEESPRSMTPVQHHVSRSSEKHHDGADQAASTASSFFSWGAFVPRKTQVSTGKRDEPAGCSTGLVEKKLNTEFWKVLDGIGGEWWMNPDMEDKPTARPTVSETEKEPETESWWRNPCEKGKTWMQSYP